MATRKKNDISRPEEQLSMEQKAFDELCTLIEELNDKGEYWLTLENKNIIFNVKLRAVFPDFFDSTINIPKSSMRKYMRGKVQQSYGDFSGFSLMSLDECAAGFLTSSMNLAFYRSRGFDITEYVVICEEDGKKPLLYDGKKTRTFRQSNPQNNVMYIPLHFISKDAVDSWNARNVAASMIQSRLMPSSKLSDELQHYQDLVSLINECSKGAREITSDGKVMEKEQTIFEKTDPKRDFSSSAQAVILNEDEKRLLECDKRRFSFITYEKDRLYDLGNGHWDLYDGAKAEGRNTYRAENGYIARNPLLDVQKNGVVAIDFGTKSTVVVYKNGSSMKIPMRIGTTNYQKVSNLGSQFENPTVEEFVDLKSFLKLYAQKSGRPETNWKDLIVANVAQKDMIDNASVLDRHYSYFSDIKQWAAGQAVAIVEDQKGYAPTIDSYMESGCEVDLVEVYAYFIGMHINNMRNGIFLNYKLSYPVSFDGDITEKIRESFERGIRKSIPEEVQKNEKVFKKYKVQLAASEPAAYAACAIQQHKIEVERNRSVFYGVFDFGGGTSDFDFGIWKECDDDDSNYSYELQRILSVGDRYLGGENLLYLLAYEIIKKNAILLSDDEITFTRPAFCERFKGDEILISDPPTRIARRNTYVLKEKMREFWESDYSNFLKEPKKNISVELINRNGVARNDIQCKVDYGELYNILEARIRAGVFQFENGRKRALETLSKIQQRYWVEDAQYIFLAGNSCKSNIITEIFHKIYEKELSGGEIKILSLLGENENADSHIFVPNGKTGVAWGLLDLNDSVKFVDNELSKAGKTEFKYYIGIGKKGKLIQKVSSLNEYGKWIKVAKAAQDEITIYYTENSAAADGNYSIQNTDVRCFTYFIDDPDDGKYVFIRMANSTSIDIVCAYTVDIDDDIQTEVTGKDDFVYLSNGGFETIDLKKDCNGVP